MVKAKIQRKIMLNALACGTSKALVCRTKKILWCLKLHEVMFFLKKKKVLRIHGIVYLGKCIFHLLLISLFMFFTLPSTGES